MPGAIKYSKAMKRIYLSPPHLDGRERELLLEAFQSNWITTLAPQVDAFEKEICEKIGIKYATALASGTAGLHLALAILGIERGDQVICSDLTFAASSSNTLKRRTDGRRINGENRGAI